MAVQSPPAAEVAEPVAGQLFHTEIRSADPPATMRFMERAFGWTSGSSPSPVHFILDLPGGGEGHIGPPSVGEAPSAVPYILVTDLRSAEAAIRELGGEVLEGAQETPQGSYLTFRAPGGPAMIAWQMPVDDPR